jgi:hypothetical protein
MVNDPNTISAPPCKKRFAIKGMERSNGLLLFTIQLACSREIITQSFLEWMEFAKVNADKDEYRNMEKALNEFMALEKNPSRLMAELAKAKVEEFFHDQHRTSYAAINIEGRREIRPIKSVWFKDWLRDMGEKATGKLAGPYAISTAIEHLAAQGRNGAMHNLYVRVAWTIKNEELFLDMANDRWQAIRITKAGWEIVDDPPVLFKRPDGMLPLVVPKKEGGIDDFMACLNQEGTTKSQLLLYKVRLASIFVPQIAKPIIVIAGDQGGGKTKYLEAEKLLLDPAIWDEHKPPRDFDQLTRDFANALVVWYGNITKLNEEQQDWICTGCSGGGSRKRQLYTDDEELFRTYKSAIGLNGINIAGSNPDFLDRIILLMVKRIPERKLMGDDEWAEKLEKALPSAMGFILTTLSKALMIYPDVKLSAKYRLASFCRWGEAISQAMGCSAGEFMLSYGRNRQMVSRMAITLSPVGQAILDFVDTTKDNFFVGTATDLLRALNEHCDEDNIKRDSEWPSNATKLSEKLNVIRLDLERAGITIDSNKNFDVRKARIKYPDATGRLERKSERTKVIVIMRAKEEGLWNAKFEEEAEIGTESQT